MNADPLVQARYAAFMRNIRTAKEVHDDRRPVPPPGEPVRLEAKDYADSVLTEQTDEELADTA